VEDLKPVAVFNVQYEVFRLSVSFDGHILGVGHYDGIITTWLLDEAEVRVSLLQCYVGHRDNVLCLCIAPELDLMCSGSRDRLANVIYMYLQVYIFLRRNIGLWRQHFTEPQSQHYMDASKQLHAPCTLSLQKHPVVI
jgi:hypothetical protein